MFVKGSEGIILIDVQCISKLHDTQRTRLHSTDGRAVKSDLTVFTGFGALLTDTLTR